MTHYAPTAITHLNAREVVENAYREAGLDVPTRVDAISAALATEPTVHEVAIEFANEALGAAGDPAELVERAISALQRAQAVETVRDAYERTVEGIARTNIDEMRDRAVNDLRGAFAKAVKRLETAAAKLDARDPLSVQKAFDGDTTAEYKAAVAALTRLARYCFRATHTDPSVVGTKLLAIVAIPWCEQEAAARDRWGGLTALPDQDGSAQRHAIRQLTRDAQRDLDVTLIKIAKGRYKGVTFGLADTDELERRRQAHYNATTYKVGVSA